MLNFFYDSRDPQRAREAKTLLDQWQETHHSSPVRYLSPGHRIVVDGSIVIVSRVDGDHLVVRSLNGGWSESLSVTPDQRFRHPLTDKVAEQALASLPPELSRLVRYGETTSTHR